MDPDGRRGDRGGNGARAAARVALLAAGLALGGCGADEDAASAPPAEGDGEHPRFLYRPEQREVLRARQHGEPWETLWKRVRAEADRPFTDPPPDTWLADVWQDNAAIAQANAILAWAFDDADAAAKARDALLRFDPSFELDRSLDDDIRMAPVVIPYVNAWDLLRATPWLSTEDGAEARRRIAAATRAFAARYLDEPFYRETGLVVTQNNHPLRAAAALGYVALAFPDEPDATRWLDWSTDQIDYLLGPRGHYVQADGGISEGPFYFAFGFSAVLPFLIALDRNDGPDVVHHRTCITRNHADPWSDDPCVEGEPFTLSNPLRSGSLAASFDWTVALRRPSGIRAELDDTKLAVLNGGAVTTGFGGAPHLLWDWHENEYLPDDTTKFFDLTAWHLGWVADVAPAEPPWRNRFFPDAGQATFRSGWGPDDRWLMLVADHGPARKSLHNHGDGTSFSLSAYGEDLLIDTGYYKPNPNANPLTTDFPSHNVVLIDGKGPPKRGLLNDWGDADAFLENVRDGETIAWAEAREAYEHAEVRRGVAFARQRYFVVADRIRSEAPGPRTFAWRAHLWAGHDAGGAYALAGNVLTMDRAKAGLAVSVAATEGAPSFVEPPYQKLAPPHVHQVQESLPGDHAVADATVTGTSPGFLAVLAPYREGATGADGKLAVTAGPAAAASATWIVAGEGFRDVAWLRGAGAPASLSLDGHTIETDAELVIASEAGDFALVAGGTRVVVDGAALVSGNADPVAIVQP